MTPCIRRTLRNPSNRARHGIASLLAMLYLVLFSVLALGFYTQVTMSAQCSASERRTMEALTAAQSGVHFARRPGVRRVGDAALRQAQRDDQLSVRPRVC